MTIPPNLAQAAPVWTFEQILQMAGWTVWPLGACLILGLACIFYNFWMLRPSRVVQPKIVAQVHEKIRSLDLDAARQLCGAYPSVMTRVLRAGLDSMEGEYEAEAVQHAMVNAANEEMTRAAMPSHYLGVLAVAAPLVGLLGTITGMLEAFASMAQPGGGPPEMLFAGLGQSLASTGLGVLVALILFLAQGFATAQLAKLAAQVQRVATETTRLLGTAIRRAYHA